MQFVMVETHGKIATSTTFGQPVTIVMNCQKGGVTRHEHLSLSRGLNYD